MAYRLQKIPEGDVYLPSTVALSNAIDEWFSVMPGITIIAINTIVSAQGQAAMITYDDNQPSTDKTEPFA